MRGRTATRRPWTVWWPPCTRSFVASPAGKLAKSKPGETLDSVALANEAYLRLVRAGGLTCEDRGHFKALCAQIMRRIVVDHARERASAKRGGDVSRVPIEEHLLPSPGHGVRVLELDEALEALAGIDPRKSRLVELRYFGGLTIDEAAEVLQVSPAPPSATGSSPRRGCWRSCRATGSHGARYSNSTAMTLAIGWPLQTRAGTPCRPSSYSGSTAGARTRARRPRRGRLEHASRRVEERREEWSEAEQRSPMPIRPY